MQRPRLTAEDLNQWRNNPVTKGVFQFLHDYREWLKEVWGSGTDLDPTVQMQAQQLKWLMDLRFGKISEFYDQRAEELNAQGNEVDTENI